MYELLKKLEDKMLSQMDGIIECPSPEKWKIAIGSKYLLLKLLMILVLNHILNMIEKSLFFTII